MCESTQKLTAWLDGELPQEDATAIENHLGACQECRLRVEMYRRASSAYDAYCDAYCEAAMACKPTRKPSARVVGAIAAAATVAAILLLAPRSGIQRPAGSGLSPVEPAVATPQAVPPHRLGADRAPIVTSARLDPARPHPRKDGSPAQVQQGSWPEAGTTVEIAIPGDAIFAPGALPDGIGFTADVTLAPDGWAQQMQVRPRLTEFERRGRQP